MRVDRQSCLQLDWEGLERKGGDILGKITSTMEERSSCSSHNLEEESRFARPCVIVGCTSMHVLKVAGERG
jgi:hypothetical protein